MIIFGAPDAAATLILSASSEAICSRRPEAASCGLVTKSNAPSDSAFRVREAPCLGVRADDDHRHAMLARDLAQHLDAVHARHFEIERHDVRVQLLDLSQADHAVHGRADDFDGWVALQHLRNQLAHERGIVHDEHADFFAHAVAPTAGIRERCETTAGTFRISTTVPSPRIEAPLTSGEVTNCLPAP